jgi:hypothetical protein
LFRVSIVPKTLWMILFSLRTFYEKNNKGGRQSGKELSNC